MQVKFRAWDTVHKEWMEKDCFLDFTGQLVTTHSLKDYDKEKVTISMYTGLKDKNGKEIYEGDIIQDDGGSGGVKYCGVIRFGENEKSPMSFWSDTSVFGTPDGLKISKFSEIIGNLYETPELLEEQHGG